MRHQAADQGPEAVVMAEQVTHVGRAGGLVELQHRGSPQPLVTAPLQRDESRPGARGKPPAQERRRALTDHVVLVASVTPQYLPAIIGRPMRPQAVFHADPCGVDGPCHRLPSVEDAGTKLGGRAMG